MLNLDERTLRQRRDPQLLLQLTRERLLCGLPRLDLSAREFPEAALVDVGRAPCDQHLLPSVAHRRRRDMDEVLRRDRAHGSSGPLRSDTRR